MERTERRERSGQRFRGAGSAAKERSTTRPGCENAPLELLRRALQKKGLKRHCKEIVTTCTRSASHNLDNGDQLDGIALTCAGTYLLQLPNCTRMEDGFVRVRKGQESHDIVYASEFNADGSSLAVGDASGTLTVFNVFQAASVNSCVALTADSGEERFYDPETFDTGGGCIYAIHAEQDAVICGTDKGLLFTTWSDLNTGDPSITLQAIQSPFPDLPCEVNAIAGLPGGKHCFAAAGDGNAYAIDVETLTQTTAFTGGGSLAFLHCITMRGSDEENVFLTVCGGHVFVPYFLSFSEN